MALVAEIIFALHTFAGLRLFTERMLPDYFVSDPPELGRFSSLLDTSDLDLNTVPLGNDLIASIGTSEQPTMEVELSNADKFWSKLVIQEPLLHAAGGIITWYGGSHVYTVFRAEVSRIRLRKRSVTIELSEP